MHGEPGGDRGNVLVEALGHLVAAEQALQRCLRRIEDQRADEFTGLQRGLLVVDIEILKRHLARRATFLQHDAAAERDQGRHRVTDRRAVGDIAAQRAGILDRRRGETAGQFGPLRLEGGERGERIGQRDASADFQALGADRDAFQFGHGAQLDDFAEIAALLGDPQADVGAAGDQAGVGQFFAQFGEFGQAARAVAAPAGTLVIERRQLGEFLERGDHRQAVERLARQGIGILRRIDDGPVTRAAAQVARQRVVDFLALRAVRLVFVEREQRHRETRGAETAL